MADLRFTAEQADALIQQVASVKLSDHDLSELVERSEGWPAGLYLAAVSSATTLLRPILPVTLPAAIAIS